MQDLASCAAALLRRGPPNFRVSGPLNSLDPEANVLFTILSLSCASSLLQLFCSENGARGLDTQQVLSNCCENGLPRWQDRWARVPFVPAGHHSCPCRGVDAANTYGFLSLLSYFHYFLFYMEILPYGWMPQSGRWAKHSDYPLGDVGISHEPQVTFSATWRTSLTSLMSDQPVLLFLTLWYIKI